MKVDNENPGMFNLNVIEFRLISFQTSLDSKLEDNPGDEEALFDSLGQVFVPPTSESLQKLLRVNRAALTDYETDQGGGHSSSN